MQQDPNEIRETLERAKRLDLPIIVVFKNGERKEGWSTGVGGFSHWSLRLGGEHQTPEIAEISEVFVADEDDGP